jgi:hypothetical protein
VEEGKGEEEFLVDVGSLALFKVLVVNGGIGS